MLPKITNVTLCVFLLVTLFALSAFGRTIQQSEERELLPAQTLERALTGAETHRYKISLKSGEFFQVRVEQKGIDVLLRLLDARGNDLAHMDSPNGDKGFEVLSFVADAAGSFVLEVKSLDEKAGRGIYIIQRVAGRTATPADRAQVAAEREQQAKSELLDKLTNETLTLVNEPNAATAPEAFQAALNKATQGLLLAQSLKSLEHEALFSFLLARLYEDKKDNQKVLEYYERTLKIINSDKEVKTALKRIEISTLKRMGRFHDNYLDNPLEAAKLYERALSLYQENEEDEDKGILLRYFGDTLKGLGFYQGAEEYYLKAVKVFQTLNLQFELGATLGQLGEVYYRRGDKPAEALKYFLDAEKLLESSSVDSAYQDTRVFNLGYISFLYKDLNDPEKELFYRDKVNKLLEKTKDPFVIYTNRVMFGISLAEAGKDEEALKAYQQALDFVTNSADFSIGSSDKVSAQTTVLKLMMLLYLRSGKFKEAKQSFDQAYNLLKDISDHTMLAGLLEDLGDGLYKGEAYASATKYYGEAFSILKSEKGRPLQVDFEQVAGVLNKLGKAQLKNGNQAGGLTTLQTALTAQMSLYQQTKLADMLQDRVNIFTELKNRKLAIFFGKQTVALKQEMRRRLKTFPVETQKSFLKGNRESYEKLVILLLQEHRFAEAIQIINLYQSQEFFDFDSNDSQTNRALSFTQREEVPLTELQRLQASLRASKEQFLKNPDFDKLSDLLKQIEVDFSQPTGEKDKAPVVPDLTEMQIALGELNTATKQKTAALYTLISEDEFHLVLITPDGEVKDFATLIKAAVLDKKILEFYALLQSPKYDPRPLGKDLYAIIFKPVEAALKKSGAQTLMWQLDGNLRYIPMAALWDGEKYLVERYYNVEFTRANRERLTRPVSQSWTGVGFGSSQAHTVDLLGDGDKISFSALPGVLAELQAIFRSNGRTVGILPGEVFADAKFTKTAFYEAMKQHRPLVHISSHFAFRPGDDSRSFLLLGDDTALTLNEIKQQGRLFDGVELLTLSACNTAATQEDANGKEIDGFAELAQRLGAGAVLATLWQVSDSSTPWLMKEFYTIRQSQSGTTKAEALRRAQLALLNGIANTPQFADLPKGGTSNLKVAVVPDTMKQTRTASRADIIYVADKDAPLFKQAGPNPKPFAHPYYWSPFVLFGSWR